jgi:F420-0:gamma-glutamyl ligase-like protein
MKKMKSGLIIYVVGKEPSNWNADFGKKTIKQNIQADLVEIITNKSGHFDVLDAWFSLMVRGMKRITCMIGEFTPNGTLALTGRELRLCG